MRQMGPVHMALGGLIIAVRDFFGLRGPDDLPSVIVNGRAMEAVADVPGMPPIHLLCVYGHSSEGLSPANLELLAAIGRRCELRKDQLLIGGGDWNLTPGQLELVGFPEQAQMALLCTGKATCISPAASREYDFFVASTSLARMLREIAALTDVPTVPHHPAIARLHPGGRRLRHLGACR